MNGWKKKFIVIVASAAVALTALIPASAAAKSDIPTIFHNDEAWYKDEIAPALMKNGILHVPSDVFAMFDYISLDVEREGENLLFVNTRTGDYVSILYSVQVACVNGRIIDGVSIFREKGCYYLDAEFMCSRLGLSVEYSPGMNDGAPVYSYGVRIYDNDRLMEFEELIAMYYEDNTSNNPSEADRTDSDDNVQDDGPASIYLICCDTGSTDYVFSRSLCEKYGYGYSLFLTKDSDTETVLKMDINDEIGISLSNTPDAVLEADMINERISNAVRRKTHIVLSSYDDETDKKLSESGYFVLKPDFEVKQTTDTNDLTERISEHLGQNKNAVILLNDVWQSENFLKGLEKLSHEYRTGGIDGIN